jgi:FkbM family methyltransferase
LRLPQAAPRSARAVLYRSFSWPLAKRLGMTAEVSVRGGSRMLVRTDDSIGRVLAISGVWEPNVTAAFARVLSPGDVCVDVGAHIGYYTLLASRLVGASGHVYAFEPSPVNYRALRANLELNGVDNVTAYEVAVGREERTAVLNEGPGTNTGRATLRAPVVERDAGRPQVTVEVRPLTGQIPAEDLERVRVVKIDAEGSEVEVLRSLAPILDLGLPLAVFLELTPGWVTESELEFLEAMWREQRLTPYLLPSGYSVAELFPAKLDSPVELTEIPSEQCDLVLIR